MTTATYEMIDGREYEVSKLDNSSTPLASAQLVKNGWDGHYYLLTGKRGATKLAIRSARHGGFQIVVQKGLR